MVKPMISTLIGIAVEEGKIKSTDNPTNYLPDLKLSEGLRRLQ
jgi:CubicO group peptidase (beta-lactamase class C family)